MKLGKILIISHLMTKAYLIELKLFYNFHFFFLFKIKCCIVIFLLIR